MALRHVCVSMLQEISGMCFLLAEKNITRVHIRDLEVRFRRQDRSVLRSAGHNMLPAPRQPSPNYSLLRAIAKCAVTKRTTANI